MNYHHQKPFEKSIENIINTYFNKIYIINLENRTDRWEKLVTKLKKYNIHNYIRFIAIDGRKEPYISTFRKMKAYTLETPGAYGLLLTVYNILLDAIEKKYERILILEDDVIFCNYFDSVFNDYIKNIPFNWKLLYLGSSMHSWRLDKRCHHNIEKKYCTTDGSIAGAFAVGIHHSVYNDLLHLIKYSYKPWDIGPLSIVNKKYRNSYVITPNIVIADVRNSDIRNNKDMNEKAAKCKWKLQFYDID